jgi:M6 family metalloprotease-like protein
MRRTLAATIVAVGLAIFLTPFAGAVPADPQARHFVKQPDGEQIEVRQFGDEWYNGFQTVEGFTVLRDPESRVWKYAVEGRSGRLKPGPTPASKEAPDSVPPLLRDQQEIEAGEMLSRTGPPPVPQSPEPANVGSQASLVILVQFNDIASRGTTPAQWNSRFFGPTDSVRDYYQEVSFNALDMGPAAESHGVANDGVVGWLTLNRPHPGSDSTAHRATVRDAILAANPFVNFAQYDKNADGSISADELHVTVIPAGWEEAICGAGTPYSVWGHNWDTWDLTPNVDGKAVGGYEGSYSMFGEAHCQGQTSHMATIGIMVHELGHDLDLPDLYNSANQTDGIGYWSVMAGGSWLSLPGQARGTMPPHPDAFSKSYQGWITPQKASGSRGIQQAATSPTAVQLGDNPGGVDWTFGLTSGNGEYFLVENRQRAGYDSALPGCGVVIWHIDETRTFSNSANADDSRRLVDLEEADNNNSPYGVGDPFLNRTFGGATTPSSRYYSGLESGTSVTVGGAQCAETMNVTVANTGGVAPPHDNFDAAIELAGPSAVRLSDSNVLASKQAGEPNPAGNVGGASVWYRWTPAASGSVSIDTIGSSFDTTLGVYTGNAVGALQPVASNDDVLPEVVQSRVEFDAVAGTAYRIAVDGYSSAGKAASGSIKLTLNQSAPSPPDTIIDSGPVGQTSAVTAQFTFSSPQAVSGFQCRLDAGAWSGCVAPKSYSDLGDGNHTFEVRSVNAAGFDPTPASRTWVVAQPTGAPTCNGKLATVVGAQSGRRVDGTAGDDVIVITGGGEFIIYASAGNDTICGGPAYDTIRPGTGDDWISGGGKNNALDYSDADEGMEIDLSIGTAKARDGSETDRLVDFNEVFGGTHGDVLLGDEEFNFLAGNGGHDLIEARGGNDLVWGDASWDTPGDDTIYGGSGRDTVLAGPGLDTIYAKDNEVDVLDCGEDSDQTDADNLDELTSCEAGIAIDQSLTVWLAGDGTGIVSSNSGINCRDFCNEEFGAGSEVVLTATPDPGSRFLGWSGDCSGAGSCVVVLSESRSVNASFGVVEDPGPDMSKCNAARKTLRVALRSSMRARIKLARARTPEQRAKARRQLRQARATVGKARQRVAARC